MTYTTLDYTVRFLTPAFLGNAEQTAQWRTPPFKALLRQWWRVAYAQDRQFNVDIAAMRREEGELFGNAWLSHREGVRDVHDHSKSKIRIRLSDWRSGTLLKAQWPTSNEAKVTHPEVGRPVGVELYLGYGPLIHNKSARGTTLKANAAIQAGEEARLSIAVPQDAEPLLLQALRLMNDFGTVGGRSRNGWGSFLLAGGGKQPAASGLIDATIALPLRPYEACLDDEWPHAIGSDRRGALIWVTPPQNDWQAIMRSMAAVKIGLRTAFKFSSGNNASTPDERHWLSYPVTNHSVRAWGDTARLPNSLRFKFRRRPDGKFVGVAFHIPHKPPASFGAIPSVLLDVWSRVHAHLDSPESRLDRASA